MIFSYYKNKEASKEVLKSVNERGSTGFFIQMNVSNGDNVKRGSNEVLRRAPYLNVLVNNAGVIFSGIVDATMLKD